jgi:hypothetical protein
MEMKDMTDFQKAFLAKGVGNKLFTQEEFNEALTMAKAEIMTLAIEASRTAVIMEREACAKIIDDNSEKYKHAMFGEHEFIKLAEEIRNRIPSQRQ